MTSEFQNILHANVVLKYRKSVAFPQSFLNDCRHDDFHSDLSLIKKRLFETLGNPYFYDEDWGFFLYNCDCVQSMEKLKEVPSFINLIVTSPPYNIGKEYEFVQDVESYVSWCEKWLDCIYNITNDNGSFWLNLGYFEVPGKGKNVPISYLLWDKSRFYLEQEIVWHYEAGVAAKKRLSPRNEKWLFYVKNNNDYVFNLDSVRDQNVKYPNQKKNGKFRCNPLGKNPSDVWNISKVTSGKNRSSKERTIHPAQFPLEVVERIIKLSSNCGDFILDPFSGSGTTGICAVALGRFYIGFEINCEYCDATVKRFNQFKDFFNNYHSQKRSVDEDNGQ